MFIFIFILIYVYVNTEFRLLYIIGFTNVGSLVFERHCSAMVETVFFARLHGVFVLSVSLWTGGVVGVRRYLLVHVIVYVLVDSAS